MSRIPALLKPKIKDGNAAAYFNADAAREAAADRLSNRRAKYLKQAAECEAKAATPRIAPMAQQFWLVAARTWRELAATSQLAGEIERVEAL